MSSDGSDTTEFSPEQLKLAKLAEESVRQELLGTHGGKFGPVLISTDRAIVLATAAVSTIAALCGYGIWATISTSLFTGLFQWLAVAALGLWFVIGLHAAFIYVSSRAAATQLQRWADWLREKEREEEK